MKKIFKSCLKLVIGVVVFAVCVVGGYVIYVVAQYNRIKDNLVLEVQKNAEEVLTLDKNKTFKVSTYNIGFGAYRPEFDFFMDTGYLSDGTKTNGSSSRAVSKESVIAATIGATDTLKALDLDFMLYQEVDTNSHRAHRINQYELIKNEYQEYGSIQAQNFHSAYLFYPITNPHGQVNSGITTLSKYKIDSAIRRSFPVSKAIPDKLFDLDRCFSVSRFNLTENKQFVLINLHMSAYDKGGTIRVKQMQMIKDVFAEEYSRGNYIVMGGDFNHDLLKNNPEFQYTTENERPEWMNFTQLKPDWLQYFDFDNDLNPNMKVATDDTVSTCRGSDMPWLGNEKTIYTAVVDGFIVSDNIEVIDVTNIDNNYEYSDHQPAVLEFKFL